MVRVKPIISVFLAVAIVFLSFSPAYAIDPNLVIQGAAIAPSFGDWIIGSSQSLANFFKGFLVDDVCQGAGPTLNNRHVFEVQHTTFEGVLGYYNVCQYCGKLAALASRESYRGRVSELPSQGYNSAGKLIWSPSPEDITGIKYRRPGNSGDFVVSYTLNSNRTGFTCGFQKNEKPLSLVSSTFDNFDWGLGFSFGNYPIDGTYCLLPTLGLSYSAVVKGNIVSDKLYNSSSGFVHYSTDKVGSYGSPCPKFSTEGASCTYLSMTVYIPVYEIIPDASVGAVGEFYLPDTRPTTITGDYAIVDNQGQVTIIKDSTIVNETTNNYYNPATGEGQPVKDWSYDYPSRTYTVTTDSNNTVTVTYGDEYVTINEGDTIYNIYYAAGEPGDGDNPACSHDWQIGDRVAPTCVQPGSQPYTCTKCKERKSDIIPSLGHNWQVLTSVTTKYDDSGQLVQEGYIIYECSRCKEQYKAVSGSGPPPSGGGSTGPGTDTPGGDGSIWDKLGELVGDTLGGIVGLLSSVISKLLDALIALGQTILDGLTAVVGTVLAIFDEVPQLFSGFVAFLAAVFPYLPEDMITLLTFGLAAIVFVGIIKAVRR